ncbi:MAG TPA: SAM-dependent methyltransferase [Chthoniobacterales bacterium]
MEFDGVVDKTRSTLVPLRNLIEAAGGWLSFERFMDAALYGAETGYYTRNIREIGRRGDFTTSAEAGSLLAEAVGAWADKQRKRIQRNGERRWHLIEIGGGNGAIAHKILESRSWLARLTLQYHIVEISPSLIEIQRRRLGRYKIEWHTSIETAIEAAEGHAIIFSNEVVDAFPCVRLEWRNNAWHEIGLVWENNRPVEQLRPLSPERIAALDSSATKITVPEGKTQRIEAHPAWRDQLQTIFRELEAGILLTIDYGDNFPAVYYRQPAGTLRGYYHHVKIDGSELYTHAGHQDLTADVNFTDIRNWGMQIGFVEESFDTQRDFILHWTRNIDTTHTANARLLDPIGAGVAFKVLAQSKNPGLI